ncbi:MAG: AbrB/MazE/SpoVT family DNA-binding domain-containing protein [Chloroflexota bacterium]
MKSKVSAKGQTVVPRQVRQALGILPDQFLDWQLRHGGVMVYPVSDDPIKASRGMLKRLGMEFSTAELLDGRREEIKLEDELDSR